jgi:sulfite reductase (NADPH) hemoprotein beta-component
MSESTNESESKLSAVEGIKDASRYLRGTIGQELRAESAHFGKDDLQLLKFHGTYQQDDRDLRPNRRKHKLDKAYSFMIRIRVPGGVATPQQWLETDRLATQFANSTIKRSTVMARPITKVIAIGYMGQPPSFHEAAMPPKNDSSPPPSAAASAARIPSCASVIVVLPPKKTICLPDQDTGKAGGH